METIIQALAYIGPAILAWIATLAYYQYKERREARYTQEERRAWNKAIREAQEEARNAWKTAYQLKDRHAKAQAYAQEITGQLDRNGQRAWKKVHTLTEALRRSNAVAKAARERAAGFQRLAWTATQAFDCIAAELYEKQLNAAPPLEVRQGRPPIEGPAHPQEAAQEARAADRSAGAGEGAGDPGNGPQS